MGVPQNVVLTGLVPTSAGGCHRLQTLQVTEHHHFFGLSFFALHLVGQAKTKNGAVVGGCHKAIYREEGWGCIRLVVMWDRTLLKSW